MSYPSTGAPRKKGRPPKPKPDQPKRPRGRPPKPKPDPDAEPSDSTFMDQLGTHKKRRASIESSPEILQIIGECARLACSQAECAAVLGVTISALSHLFHAHPEAREAWDDGHQASRVKLRSMQFKLAERNQIMAIFLGKNMLGQKDVQNIDATVSKPANEMTEEQLLDIIAQGSIGKPVPAKQVH